MAHQSLVFVRALIAFLHEPDVEPAGLEAPANARVSLRVVGQLIAHTDARYRVSGG